MFFVLPLALLVGCITLLLALSNLSARTRANQQINRQARQLTNEERQFSSAVTTTAADYFGYDSTGADLYSDFYDDSTASFDQQARLHLDQSMGDGT